MKSTAFAMTLMLALAGATACTEQVFTEPQMLGGEEIEAEVLNAGYDQYMRYCYACHGEEGDGKGPAAPGLWPPPRDFTQGVFKFAGITDEYLPTDDELMRIVKNGLTGTAMLPWDIDDDELWLAIQYIKSFSQDEYVDEETGKKIRAKGFRHPRKKIKAPEIPPDPFEVMPREARWDEGVFDAWIEEQRAAGVAIPTDTRGLQEYKRDKRAEAEAKRAEVIAKGEEVYHAGGCQLCHPAYVAPEQIVAWGGTPRANYPYDSDPKRSKTYGVTLLPPDFTRHYVRSPKRYYDRDGNLRYDPRDFYRVISSGIPGTAMPSWAALPPERVWAVSYYVASLSEMRTSPEARALRDRLLALPPWSPPEPEPEPAAPADAEAAGAPAAEAEAAEAPAAQ